MKKLLLMLALVMFGFATYAQDCTAKCKIGKDDLKVDYFKKGVLVINNQSNEKIAKIHIKVTCTETYTDNNAISNSSGKKPQKTETIVLFDKNVTNILPKKTMEVTDGVKSAEKAPHGGKLSDFKISLTEVKSATNEKGEK